MKAVRANGATSGADVLAAFGYDDLGRRSSLTRGDGSVASYGYDAVSRLTQLADNLVGTASDQTIDLAYNPAGQNVSRTGSNDSYSFVSYANGTIGSTADGLNRLASLGSASPTHDARGNMTSDGASAFTYSSENLLTSATGSATLTYDPLMRLSRWLENGAGRRNLYDGPHLALETDDNGNVRSRHVFGSGVDEPLVTYSGTGTTAASAYHLHADERGSVTAASRGSDGSVAAINKYDEYGMPGPLPRFGRYRYTGQAFYGNLGTGLYDYKARWYHPSTGRFLQTDPIGLGGGMNPYPYVGGDPVNRTDPLGLSPDKLEENPIIITAIKPESPPLPPMRSGTWGAINPGNGGNPEPGEDRGQDRPTCDTPGADQFNCDPVVNGPPKPQLPSTLPPLVQLAQNQLDRLSRPMQCVAAGHLCLQLNPSGPESRKQCKALEQTCSIVARQKKYGPANDNPEKDGGTELCYGAVCVQINSHGTVLPPYPNPYPR